MGKRTRPSFSPTIPHTFQGDKAILRCNYLSDSWRRLVLSVWAPFRSAFCTFFNLLGQIWSRFSNLLSQPQNDILDHFQRWFWFRKAGNGEIVPSQSVRMDKNHFFEGETAQIAHKYVLEMCNRRRELNLRWLFLGWQEHSNPVLKMQESVRFWFYFTLTRYFTLTGEPYNLPNSR